jgi:hypothetical protein
VQQVSPGSVVIGLPLSPQFLSDLRESSAFSAVKLFLPAGNAAGNKAKAAREHRRPFW